MRPVFTSFQEFWPHYLRQHSLASTRKLHLVGTGVVFFALLFSLIVGDFVWLLVSLPVAYGLSWLGHALERNEPATFSHPLWSLRGDFRMFWLWLTGRLDDELEAAGVMPPASGQQ